jgi:hypothetical protein
MVSPRAKWTWSFAAGIYAFAPELSYESRQFAYCRRHKSRVDAYFGEAGASGRAFCLQRTDSFEGCPECPARTAQRIVRRFSAVQRDFNDVGARLD